MSGVRKEARGKLMEIYQRKFNMKEKDPEIYSYCLEDNMKRLYKEENAYKRVMNRFFSYINVTDSKLQTFQNYF